MVWGHADFDALRIFLRYVYVNAQGSDLRDVKEIGFHAAAAARIDKVADIDVSCGHNSVERSIDLLE